MLLPKTLDPIRVAKQGAHLEGQLSLHLCERLQAICDQADLQARVIMDLNMDIKANVPFIRGNITTTVNMICQRCNKPMQYDLDIPFSLCPMASEKQAKNLPSEYEPLMVHDEQVIVSEMIEDEILLALPMIPRHEDGQLCQAV